MRTPRSGSVVGSLRAIDATKGAIRMEDAFQTDIDDLWSAVTDPERLARWVAVVEGDLRVGGRFYARFTTGAEGPGHIDACEAPSRLVVTIATDTHEETVIEVLLTPVGEKTRLVIEERGLPLGTLADYGAGWNVHVEDLGRYLEGRDLNDLGARWEELIASYRTLAASL